MNSEPRDVAIAEPAELFALEGRVAIVTGASSGLGYRFARVLSSAGARVVLAARRAKSIERLAEELQALSFPTDITLESDRNALVEAAVDHFGQIDVLVNNAGIVNIEAAELERLEDFRNVIDVNLVAQFALCQLAGRVMLRQGSGSIINVASVLGLVGVGQIPQASYTASKGGLINLTRELAAQWARRGVRVNAIAPGWFPSDMTESLFADERSLAWLKRKIPMGRGGRPGELDGILLYLAGEASSYVTGQVIAVDGGMTAI